MGIKMQQQGQTPWEAVSLTGSNHHVEKEEGQVQADIIFRRMHQLKEVNIKTWQYQLGNQE
eukprot:14228203-Ditylum_brightwellii.AAC.1